MMMRYLSSAAAGIAATTALLYLMHFLIASSERVLTDPPDPLRVTWGIDIEETEAIRDSAPEPPKRHDLMPPELPPTEDQAGTDRITVSWKHTPTGPDTRTFNPDDFRFSNGPLVNVFKVQPTYPLPAVRRELEGYATVQFDVTEAGTVSNVVVIESTHRLFEKPAIEAAYRFRYKPQVVDGVPQITRGLLYRFRFEMNR